MKRLGYTRNDLTLAVCKAIRERFDVPATYEYPGFIAIPERVINDDVDASDNAWAIGTGDADGEWTGQLMTADGSRVVGEMGFAVYPKSEDPTVIADAIYTHGIGDLYIGGGCSDADCPRRKPATV